MTRRSKVPFRFAITQTIYRLAQPAAWSVYYAELTVLGSATPRTYSFSLSTTHPTPQAAGVRRRYAKVP